MGPLPKPLALTAYTALRHIHFPSGRCQCMPSLKLRPFCLYIFMKKGWNPHGVPLFSYWQEKMIAYFVAYFSHIFAYFSHNFAYFDFPFHRIIPPPLVNVVVTNLVRSLYEFRTKFKPFARIGTIHTTYTYHTYRLSCVCVYVCVCVCVCTWSEEGLLFVWAWVGGVCVRG